MQRPSEQTETLRGPSSTNINPVDLPMDTSKQDFNIITGHNNAYYKYNVTKCWRNNCHLIDEDYKKTVTSNPGMV
jgi:hypothetical protein